VDPRIMFPKLGVAWQYCKLVEGKCSFHCWNRGILHLTLLAIRCRVYNCFSRLRKPVVLRNSNRSA